jgi:hypothetical protein
MILYINILYKYYAMVYATIMQFLSINQASKNCADVAQISCILLIICNLRADFRCAEIYTAESFEYRFRAIK